MQFSRRKKRRVFGQNPNIIVSGAPVPTIQLPRRQRKSASKLKRLTFFAFILVGFILLILVATKLPAFAIRTIIFTDTVDDQNLVNDVNVNQGKSLILFDTNNAIRTLTTKYPKARYIAIKKHFPNSLIVTIDARSPIAILVESERDDSFLGNNNASSSSAARKIKQGRHYYIDTEGVPFHLVADGQEIEATGSGNMQLPGLPLILVQSHGSIELGKKLDTPIIARAIEIIPEAQNRALAFLTFTDAPLSQATDSAKGIEASLAGGITVLFSQEKPGSDQVAALQTILDSTKIERSKIKKIDLRFIKPYVTLK